MRVCVCVCMRVRVCMRVCMRCIHVRVHCILSVYVRGGAQGVIDTLTMCYKNSPAIIHSVFNIIQSISYSQYHTVNIIQSISYSQYQMDKKTWHATK